MARLPRTPNSGLPTSLSIAIWLIGAAWAVAILAHVFDAPHEIIYAALVYGLLAGIVEWLVLRGRGR